MTEIFDDIRKLYRFYIPGNELAEYIEFFSESSSVETYIHTANKPFTVRMFPSWTPTCYINLGESYQLNIGNSQRMIRKSDDVLILRNNIVERHNLPTDHIFTIKFFPGGLEAILGINQVGIADNVIDLDSVLPPILISRVKELTDFEQRIDLLQQFFLIQYNLKRKRDHYRTFVTSTIATYTDSGMSFNNEQLADRHFTTSKTINRYFHRVVGTSPKNYLALVRARTALTTFVDHNLPFDPTHFGYYDLSHFYKDIFRFTGEKLGSQRH